MTGTDSFGRRIDYLRISLTDRCNLRCVYCMPEEGVPWRDHTEVLSFEEIERLARVFSMLGVDRVRLTGGEPLLRRNLPDLVSRIGPVQTNPWCDLQLPTRIVVFVTVGALSHGIGAVLAGVPSTSGPVPMASTFPSWMYPL